MRFVKDGHWYEMLGVAGCHDPFMYEILVTKFCRWPNIGEWQVADCVRFMDIYLIRCFTSCALNELPHHGIQERQSQKQLNTIRHFNFGARKHSISRSWTHHRASIYRCRVLLHVNPSTNECRPDTCFRTHRKTRFSHIKRT